MITEKSNKHSVQSIDRPSTIRPSTLYFFGTGNSSSR